MCSLHLGSNHSNKISLNPQQIRAIQTDSNFKIKPSLVHLLISCLNEFILQQATHFNKESRQLANFYFQKEPKQTSGSTTSDT